MLMLDFRFLTCTSSLLAEFAPPWLSAESRDSLCSGLVSLQLDDDLPQPFALLASGLEILRRKVAQHFHVAEPPAGGGCGRLDFSNAGPDGFFLGAYLAAPGRHFIAEYAGYAPLAKGSFFVAVSGQEAHQDSDIFIAVRWQEETRLRERRPAEGVAELKPSYALVSAGETSHQG